VKHRHWWIAIGVSATAFLASCAFVSAADSDPTPHCSFPPILPLGLAAVGLVAAVSYAVWCLLQAIVRMFGRIAVR
jgi:hypothetical protein